MNKLAMTTLLFLLASTCVPHALAEELPEHKVICHEDRGSIIVTVTSDGTSYINDSDAQVLIVSGPCGIRIFELATGQESVSEAIVEPEIPTGVVAQVK